MSDGNSIMVKLMTLINVSAARPNKRKHVLHASYPSLKRKDGSNIHTVTSKAANILREAKADEVAKDFREEAEVNHIELANGSSTSTDKIEAAEESDDEDNPASTSADTLFRDAFEFHFAAEGNHTLSAFVKKVVGDGNGKQKESEWDVTSTNLDKLGEASISRARGIELPKVIESRPQSKVLEAFQDKRKGREISPSQIAFIKLLGTYQDVFNTKMKLEDREQIRRIIALHAMSHVQKNRRKVLRNNERLAKAASTKQNTSADTRDQGFTRAKVLLLLPFRNSALSWMSHFSALSTCTEIDNLSRFQGEYSLPKGTIDKLTQPEARSKYPIDHIETFKGNIDDNFRIGAKVTRKSFKIFSQFYESDVIIASPLGLRLAIEKDRDSDFLSSIEILIMDQMDVMAMQNWDHIQFVMSHLNQIPKQAHGVDFSRVKQWYLDSQASLMRQSVLLSSYDSPEFRSLYRSSLKNVAGKIHLTCKNDPGILSEVRKGIRTTFTKFTCNTAQDESRLRIDAFLTKTFKILQKSALSSSNTIIFVPSYLDFIQLQEKLRKDHPELYNSFAMLTEYSTGKEIAKNRTQFFNEKKKFLIVTERFVFYRRYILRGAKTIVWFGLPEHKEFYVEFLENMFHQGDKKEVSNQETIDVGDVSVMGLYSKYDYLKLERIVGTELATKMISEEQSQWRFA